MKEIIQRLRNRLIESGKGQIRPASGADLKRAIDAGFPGELIEFYREYEPDPQKQCIKLRQRIWCINSAIEENKEAVPGVSLFPRGYVVFASNNRGDSYCLDTNVSSPDGHHPVVLFPHDAFDESAPLSEILEFRLEVASSIKDFLEKFAEGTLTEKPNNLG